MLDLSSSFFVCLPEGNTGNTQQTNHCEAVPQCLPGPWGRLSSLRQAKEGFWSHWKTWSSWAKAAGSFEKRRFIVGKMGKASFTVESLLVVCWSWFIWRVEEYNLKLKGKHSWNPSTAKADATLLIASANTWGLTRQLGLIPSGKLRKPLKMDHL